MEILKVILTSLLSVAVLFLIAKILGHKQMSQLDFFDYITGITVGSVAAELATELEKPWKPLIAMVIYGGTTFLLGILTSKFSKTRKYVNGTPIPQPEYISTEIIMDGKILEENLKRRGLDRKWLEKQLAGQGHRDAKEIFLALCDDQNNLTIYEMKSTA